MSTDQNLLFGVLALQADLLDAAHFAEACSAWATRKDVALADLLVERGWLTVEDRADVDRLVQRKLRKHNGDARASLAEITTNEVRHSLASVTDDAVRQSLAEPPTRLMPEPGLTTLFETQGRGRYTLTHLHAQGGIGQIWMAHDSELGRDVALKELRPERQGHATARARFLEEARVTGQLEHPGIVPVHELVRREDGGAFYTMRLVRGRTLAEAIKDYHRKRQIKKAGALELRSLLGALVSVCNAVAYAHSRGVLHRDLKPANVVLGDYGEVVVLDWGLARMMGQQPTQSDATELLPVSVDAGSRDETVQGQVLGTPGYMAPEQAMGRLDLLGPHTDTYGLGAVLYEILTGRPPFPGIDTPEVLQSVARQEPVRPRQEVPATPRPLEAVCLKALAKKPAERYATASELATEVEHWLADEPVRAWREPLRLRGTLGTAASVPGRGPDGGGVSVPAGGRRGGHLVDKRAAASIFGNGVGAGTGRDAATTGQTGGARGILEHAQTRVGGFAPAAMSRRLTQARAELDLELRLETILRTHGESLNPNTQREQAQRLDREYAELFAQSGLGEVGEDEDVVAERVAASGARRALLAALDNWAATGTQDAARRAWALGVARRVDPHPLRDRLREPGLWADRQKLAQAVAGVNGAELTPPLARVLGMSLAMSVSRAEGERLLRQAHQANPSDFWLAVSLSNVLSIGSKYAEAEGYSRAALALRPGNSLAHIILGTNLFGQGKVAEGEAMYRKAVELEPTVAFVRTTLGMILQEQGKLAEAETMLRKAVELEPRSAFYLNNLGDLMQRRGKLAEAEAMHRKAIEVDPQWVFAYSRLGNLLQGQKKWAEAETMYRKAVELHPRFAYDHNNLGWVLLQQGKLAEAEAILRKAIELEPKFVSAHNSLRAVLGKIQANLGKAHFEKGMFDESVAHYRKATEFAPNDAQAHLGLGTALQATGQIDEAIASLRKAIALDPKDALAPALLGMAQLQESLFEDSLASYRKSVRLVVTAIEAQWYAEVRRFLGSNDKVICLTLSPDGKRMASGCWGNNTEHVARIWDLDSGKEVLQLKGHTGGIVCVAWSKDGKKILTGSLDDTVRLWDASNGKSLLTIPKAHGGLHAVLLSDDGKKAISAGGGNSSIIVWDLATGKEARRIQIHTAAVRGLAWMPGGKQIVSAGFDGAVRIIDLESGKEIRKMNNGHLPLAAWFVAVSRDGKRIASSGSDKLVRLWDAETGKQIKEFAGHTEGVHGIAYSACGNRLLSVSNDMCAILWNIESGKEAQRMEVPEGGGCVAFSTDDAHAIVACQDKTLRMWKIRQ